MAQPSAPIIREVLLQVIDSNDPKGRSGFPSLQQSSVLSEAANKLDAGRSAEFELAVLTQWNELFRTGILGWGVDLSNPDPPFFHLTERGKGALESITRDPSNPAGYTRHLNSVAKLDPVAMSYLAEGLDCYVSGLFKAAAVMVGCAAESMILNLRDLTVQKIKVLGKSIPSDMNDWKIKTISDSLRDFFDSESRNFSRQLREMFDAYWAAFAQQIRATRNEAGHPTSVDPVTQDTVHASLLVFPELARIADGLSIWISNNLI